METGYLDRFGAVRTINKTIDGIQQSREFMTIINSEVQSGMDRNTGSGITPVKQRQIMKKHRGREVKLKCRQALNCLEPTG